ncbi:MAG TPA: metalloregulator ArsR/SmtB family transcription factor [Gaiellaceae bacterium]|nr:metalloregulator ArsR/SmtB family transcription factor [Gaiellaceae bacterium]
MEVFEALADPTRRRIVELLAEGERSAGELAGEFRLTRPAVSKHLRVLREAGVVDVRGDAQRRIYRLEPEALGTAEEWLARHRGFWQRRLDALEAHIEKEE